MRILIADDNQFVRRGIAGFLSDVPDCEICAEASDGPEAVRKVRELRPDLVLLDISMPTSNGFETARLIRREFPQTKILIMSQNDPASFLPCALAVGADGCLDKAQIHAELPKAIYELGSAGLSNPRAQS